MHSTLTFLLSTSLLLPLASAQGWILSGYLDSTECSGENWYIADSVGGEWQCSDIYGKNPDGEYPAPDTIPFEGFMWTGAEDCGLYPGGGCGNFVSDVHFYSDEGCLEETE